MNRNRKKTHLAGVALLFALLLSQSAHASAVTFTLSQASQTGAAGTTLDFFGTITNNDTSTVYLNGDNFTLPSTALSLDDAPFFSLPSSLGPNGSLNASTGLVELFDITIASNAAPGTYTGNFFQILGGSTNTSSDLLGTQEFTITVPPVSSTPEPSTIVLLAGGLAAIALKKLIHC
jgi:hypothetical protein